MEDLKTFDISIDDVMNIYETDKQEMKEVSLNYQMCNTCKSCQAGKC